MIRPRRVVIAAAVAAVAAATCVGAYAAYRATVTNTGNSFAAGTVVLSDNDAGTALFTTLTAMRANDIGTNCIRVRSDGTLASTVKLYGTTGGSLASYLTLTVTRGTDPTPSFGSCATFTPDATNYVGQGAGVIFNNTLSSFPASYASGITDPAVGGGTESWTQNDMHVYRFVLSAGTNTAAQGLSATASFTWEARSQ